MIIHRREMAGRLNPLTEARDYASAIPIISPEETMRGMEYLIDQFRTAFPDLNRVVVVPIMRGGRVVGEALAQTGASMMPMRMTYYDANSQRLPEPICLEEPDIDHLIGNGQPRDIVFAEAVVESQGTIQASQRLITEKIQRVSPDFTLPTFYTYTLVSKTGNAQIQIPNLRAAFRVDPEIWVCGMGCDLNEQGRELMEMRGILSPFAQKTPLPPFHTPLFENGGQ